MVVVPPPLIEISSCFAIFIALGDVVDRSSFCCSFLLLLGVVIFGDAVTDSTVFDVVVIAGAVELLANFVERYDIALGLMFSVLRTSPPTLLLLLSLVVFI